MENLYIMKVFSMISNINHVMLVYIGFNLLRINLEKDQPSRILKQPTFAIGTKVIKLSN